MSERRTSCTWFLPPGMRSAIDAEAARQSTTPSRVVEAFFRKYLPDFVADAIAADLSQPGERAQREAGAT